MNRPPPAELSGFFAVGTHDADGPCVRPWQPMAELATASDAWDHRIAAVRASLAATAGVTAEDVELRVAASVAQLGVCARIVAPALAVAVLDRAVLDTSLARLRWQPILGGPFPLSVPRVGLASTPLGAAELASALRHSLIDDTARSLVDAIGTYSVSALVAWGNVASALHGAARMLTAERPGLAGEIDDVISGLMATGALRQTGRTTESGAFRRRSCCLIYRVTGRPTAICGDCVLADGQRTPRVRN